MDTAHQPKYRPVWSVEHHPVVTTTQSLARARPAWSAVTADEQTAGRGQRERRFVSDPGGLYLTAVLPYAGDPLASRGFALAVGWAVRAALRRAGVVDLRLRWPNDLMIGSRKVGGILVEQAGADTLLVGLGLNISNHPWRADPTLGGIAGRLADNPGGETLPSRTELAARLLRAIGVAHFAFARRRLAGFAPVLNRCWGPPSRVRLELVPRVGLVEIEGEFNGIGSTGCVVLRTDTGALINVAEHYISRLCEVRLAEITPALAV